MGLPLYQIKRRVEPITSLYVDLTAAADAAANELEADTLASLVPKKTSAVAVARAPTPIAEEEVKKGAIIAQTKKSFKLKTSRPPGQ